MSTDLQQPQQRYEQFVQLLPLTLAIAGLSKTDSGKYLTDDQMEIRTRSVRSAYKHARNLIKEVMQE